MDWFDGCWNCTNNETCYKQTYNDKCMNYTKKGYKETIETYKKNIAEVIKW